MNDAFLNIKQSEFTTGEVFSLGTPIAVAITGSVSCIIPIITTSGYIYALDVYNGYSSNKMVSCIVYYI